MSRGYLFTSESASDGHPDKLADRLTDAILDRYLEIEPMARVAIKTLVAPLLCAVDPLRHLQALQLLGQEIIHSGF
ncbi:hypothetical protein HNO52_05285 [Billgrantia diversa]|uniref:S-adenosylmethionine synthetase N-terminal domain-containing protein n=1 Tax=Halomonas sp. MCCC 1A13316 TaxID=2733487 RepID=UPI0018A6684E|nr:S-adenosylmethionine synthetase N-terminal domain-containing protein [Halomonas sp. MCCC 1A13316]QOR37983.1 hypothetical protein HNO52_05285 [Halomonas sp. MCCC 1A13316]